MTKLYIDFETRSCADIKKVGAWKYAADPSTEIMCMAYALAGEEPKLRTGEELKIPCGFKKEPVLIVAHNAHFEYAIYYHILHKRYCWPALTDPKFWSCTLSRAAMCNLPISLDACGAALNIKVKKDLTGRAAMLKLTRPIAVDALGFPTYREDEDLKKIMYEYCKKDVEAEMEIDARLPELPENERKIWQLDLLINRRGVKADVLTAGLAVGMADSFTKTLNEKLVKLTGGAVEKASRVAAIKSYLASKGVVTESLDKTAVSKLMADPAISPQVKEVIKIRQQVGKSSTAKYQTILDYASDKDQRMRGMLQYHAAGTGRWGGRGPQPQNFPKGLGFESEDVVNDINRGEEFFAAKHKDKSMDALSAALRGVLMADEGKVLVSADYSAIEARVLLWLAGDHFALAKYKMGINLYVDMAKFIYNDEAIGKDTHKKEYAVGKAAVLGCGYGMGKDKFYGTCQSWGIDIPIETAEAAVQAYRKKYKKVVEFWYATEKAARAAVRTPGSVHSCGGGDLGPGVAKAPAILWGMDKRREFLVCKLPSGRHLRYFRPSLRAIETPYGEKEEIHYWCAGLGGKLEENKTYGGSLVENIVQGTARDIMANGMLNAEAAGFPVILTVHDELVTEIPDGKKDAVDHLIKAMCSLPPWAAGCPIAAEGWMGKRYRK